MAFLERNFVNIGGNGKAGVSSRLWHYLGKEGETIDEISDLTYFASQKTILMKNDIINVVLPEASGVAIYQLIVVRINTSEGEVETSLITSNVPPASETTTGTIKIATEQEARDGTDDTKAMTPLKVKIATETIRDDITDLTNDIEIIKNHLQQQIDDIIADYEQTTQDLQAQINLRALQSDLQTEKTRAETKEAEIVLSITNETSRAINVENNLNSVLTNKQDKSPVDDNVYALKNGQLYNLQSEFNAIQQNIDNAFNQLNQDIDWERADRIQEDNNLQQQLGSKLETVATDGTTIEGNGTINDPLHTTTRP